MYVLKIIIYKIFLPFVDIHHSLMNIKIKNPFTCILSVFQLAWSGAFLTFWSECQNLTKSSEIPQMALLNSHILSEFSSAICGISNEFCNIWCWCTRKVLLYTKLVILYKYTCKIIALFIHCDEAMKFQESLRWRDEFAMKKRIILS